MTDTMIIRALVGGAATGLAAGGLLWVSGRIAGNSGILAGAVEKRGRERSWRWAWLAGMLAGGTLLLWLIPSALAAPPELSPGVVIAAGLLVGFGSRLDNGCTSGHGVCGVGRLSPRSIVATSLYLLAGALTVALWRSAGGAS